MLTSFTFSNPQFLGNVGQENPSASEDFVYLICNFIVDDGSSIIKKLAVYHQFYAMNKTVEYTLSACGIVAEFQKRACYQLNLSLICLYGDFQEEKG